MEILTQILILKPNTDVTIAELLIEKVKVEIALFCRTAYIAAMDNLCADLVIYKLNMIGTEGLSGQSYNGISENYKDDYPIGIKKQLYSFRKNVIFK